MAFELTKTFVEKLLGEPINSFQVKSGSNEGDNVQGVLKALTVETSKGETLHLVHKTMSADPITRPFIIDSQTFRIENRFYSQIAPAIEQLIKTRSPDDYQLPIPKVYATFNNDNDDYTTMEDLRPSGYKMVDKYTGLSFPEVSLFLRELGRFHAFTYFFIKYEGEQVFETVESNMKRLAWLTPDRKDEVELMQQKMSSILIDMVSKRNPELSKKIESVLTHPNAPAIGARTSLSTDKKYFPVIIHGDCWINNLMFKYDDNGKPIGVKLIDFQMTRRGNVFEELQYFFLTSTTPEFRSQHLYQSLDIYYQSFTSTLRKVECPLPIGFTLGFLVDNLLEAFHSQWHSLAFVVGLQLGEPVPPPPGASPLGPPKPPMSGSGEAPSPLKFTDIPLEIRINGLMSKVRAQLEATPKAVDRLVAVTEELANLRII